MVVLKQNNVDFSIIIPHRNSINTLKRLLDSIPDTDRIEIIVVDNSPIPISKEDIGIDRKYILLWSSPSRYAGGARNEGIESSSGKWLLFADADDYFTSDAFEVFRTQINTSADVIFYKMTGIYPETGEYSTRGEVYSSLVSNYIKDGNEMPLRLRYISPCAKMIRRSFVVENKIKFDEVIASNDMMFSTKVGFYAREISAVDKEVYVVTVSKGSLTKRRDFEVIHSRFLVSLERNLFLKENGLDDYQSMVIHYIYQSIGSGVSSFMLLLREARYYRQNIFFNTRKLLPGYLRFIRKEKKDQKYYVK